METQTIIPTEIPKQFVDTLDFVGVNFQDKSNERSYFKGDVEAPSLYEVVNKIKESFSTATRSVNYTKGDQEIFAAVDKSGKAWHFLTINNTQPQGSERRLIMEYKYAPNDEGYKEMNDNTLVKFSINIPLDGKSAEMKMIEGNPVVKAEFDNNIAYSYYQPRQSSQV